MKMRIVWLGFCLALSLFPGACSKSDDASKLPPMQVQGMDVDIPKLSAQFAKANPDLQQRVGAAVTKVRYTRYMQAMEDLDAVLTSPGVTEPQKKIVTQVMSQLKEVIAKNPGMQ